jgi:ribonuclease HI
MYLALGVLPLHLHADVVSCVESATMLRSRSGMQAMTSQARLHRACLKSNHMLNTAEFTASGVRLHGITAASNTGKNRLARAFAASLRLSITASWRADPSPPCLPFSTSHEGSQCLALGCPVLTGAGTPAALAYYCQDDDVPQTPLAVFTDGSWSNGRSGFAAVLCPASHLADPAYNFAPDTCLILTGTAPAAAANYDAEMQGILTALHAIPLQTHITVYSDALSALLVIFKDIISDGARQRLGSRPLVCLARALLTRRAALGSLTCKEHVPSHTGRAGAIFEGNRVADSCASQALGAPADPAVTYEESIIFWELLHKDGISADGPLPDRLRHISGPLRPALRKKAQAMLLVDLQGAPSQGAVARLHGPALLRHLASVRRTKCPSLYLFVVRASVRQLPTADKLLFGAAANRACPLCGTPQRAEHAFVCPGNGTARAHRLTLARGAIVQLCGAVARLSATSATHHACLHSLPDQLLFYDVTRPAAAPDPDDTTPLSRANQHDRWSGLLGILPPSLAPLLLPPACLSPDERVVKSARKALPGLLQSLSLQLAHSAKACFDTWLSLSTPAPAMRVPDVPPPPWRQPEPPPMPSAPTTTPTPTTTSSPSTPNPSPPPPLAPTNSGNALSPTASPRRPASPTALCAPALASRRFRSSRRLNFASSSMAWVGVPI